MVFLQLSVDNPDMPVFVRNLGACFYYLRRPDPALSNLREYLHKKKDIAPDDRSEVEGWIAEMDKLRQYGPTPATGPVPAACLRRLDSDRLRCSTPASRAGGADTSAAGCRRRAPAASRATSGPGRDARTAAAPAVAAPPQTQFVPAPPYTAPATAMPPGPGPAVAVAQLPPPSESGSGRKTAAWVLGGVGVVGLVAGGFLTYFALSDFSDIQTKYDPGKYSDGKACSIGQFVAYGLGGAAIVTAIILLATGQDAPKSVALAPAVGPGMAGAALSGTF